MVKTSSRFTRYNDVEFYALNALKCLNLTMLMQCKLSEYVKC